MNEKPSLRIVVFRFGSLGDVTMTIPVLWVLTKQYPHVDVTFVSRKFAKSLLACLPSVHFVEFDSKGQHKGIWGLLKLFRELVNLGTWDGVVDLHDVIRTKLLRFLFRFTKTQVTIIDKGRREKREITRRKNKLLRPLKHTVVRYSEAFSRLEYGLELDLNFKGLFDQTMQLNENILRIIGSQKTGKWIGVAPFAKHMGKSYPLERIKVVIQELTKIPAITIMLFGSRGEEQKILDEIAAGNKKIINLTGTLSLDQELEVMSNLKLMVSMDSANMHLASLVGIPVVSIWGATHPYAGFYGWTQPSVNAIQIDLYCRPCSVYGNKPCYRGDYACMYGIEPGQVISEVNHILERS